MVVVSSHACYTHVCKLSITFIVTVASLSLLHLTQVEPQEKKKKKTGRAKRRMQYNRRFVNVVATFGKRRGPNSNAP